MSRARPEVSFPAADRGSHQRPRPKALEVTFDRMVMPRSRSRSLELSRNAPDCWSSRSTSVVLP